MEANKRSHLSGAQKRKKKAQKIANNEKLPKITLFIKSSPDLSEGDNAGCRPIDIYDTASKSNTAGNGKKFKNGDNVEENTVNLIINESIGVTCNVKDSGIVQSLDVDQGLCARENIGTKFVSNEDYKHNLIDSGVDGELPKNEEVVLHTKTDNIILTQQKDVDSSCCNLPLPIETVLKHPTDKGHFKKVGILTADAKRSIISLGSCRPMGPFPTDVETGTHFSEYHYEAMNKAGVKIPRSWLCYSEILDCAYCEPCWLFADRSSPHFQSAWVNGVRAWKRLGDKIKDHEASTIHHQSCIVYEIWRQNKTVDKDVEAQILREKSYWCEVLDRILNIIITLATCSLPFRGHREEIGEGQNGNFLSIVELLAIYDPILQELISKPAGSIRYLSSTIQNELINLLSNKIVDKIVADINGAPFFSIIMDTTQDISKTDQLSQIYRYVQIKNGPNNKPTEIIIKESFLGFKKIEDQTAAGLEVEIIDTIEKKGIQLTKCRGQGYDGAAVMSGTYNGVQRRILNKEENAIYMHCCAHNLNLVLNDAVNGIPEVATFFDTLERIYVFFANSIKRWALLSTFLNLTNRQANKKLKRLCPTRWSSRNESLLAIRFRYLHIMKALSKLILTSQIKSEKEEACSLKKQLETFEFIFQLVLHTKIFTCTHAVSISLQRKDTELSKANDLLKTAHEELKKFRDEYENAKTTATEMSAVWKVEPKFNNKRIKKTKHHFDELCEDERLTDAESRFRVNVFFGCLDIVNSQLQERFKSIDHIMHIFQAIQPQDLVYSSDTQVFEKAQRIVNKYGRDIGDNFPSQLISLRSCLKNNLSKLVTVQDFANLLLIENHSLSASFPDVCTVLLLFLTIPVTVATAERSFSKLKPVKNYLRSTMGQERLCGLTMMSIELEEANQLRKKLPKIINEFAETKVRKKQF